MSLDPKEAAKAVKNALSHPPEAIKFHITTGVCLAVLLALVLVLYLFFTTFKNDPVLYTHMSLGGNEKEKY
ncbi:putative integral membrane protein [Theileria parva strain Muguga]|uniref:putative integral membrane protein n=1 Tax=Theileria parva strain Muguga TaxID=333668 RepID=UPI001C61AFAC|nr:putative integral membrane protein [Theileria parva strain Muguga]EAN30804.2 putative integral membrane protein [Theileria parva strain Muguga]